MVSNLFIKFHKIEYYFLIISFYFIDSSTILNKNKLHYKNISTRLNKHETSLLPLLYTNDKASSTSLLSMMDRIEPKEIRVNSTVDDLLKKFSNESKLQDFEKNDLVKFHTNYQNIIKSEITDDGRYNEKI